MAFEDKGLLDLHCVFLSMRDEIQRNKIHQKEQLTLSIILQVRRKKSKYMYTPQRNENCLPIGDPEFWSGKTNPEYS